MNTKPARVALRTLPPAYPDAPPFAPGAAYPESPISGEGAAPENRVYAAFRLLLADLGLDAERFGTAQWNPLGVLAPRGGTVLIKPNLVVSEHDQGLAGLHGTVCHPAVIRAAIDYAFLAVGPQGQIIVGDCPIKEVDFERLAEISGLRATVDTLQKHGVPVTLEDFRDLAATRDRHGVIVDSRPLPGDRRGVVAYDLGSASLFGQLSAAVCRRLRSTAAVYEEAASSAHTPTLNRYTLTGSVLAADLVLSLAKLKTHRKTGMTGALKNVIGMTNEKRLLPHHRAGTPAQGGDICPDAAPATRKLAEGLRQRANASRHGRLLYAGMVPAFALARRLRHLLHGERRSPADIGEGSWWGNDTIWRTTLDMNVLVRYGTRAGQVAAEPQRAVLAVIDAVLAGDGEGPLYPTPKPVGALLAGADPVACDIAAAYLAGFDPVRIPMLARAGEAARHLGESDPARITVCYDGAARTPAELPNHHFRPSSGWAGQIERPESAPRAAR